MGSVSETNDCEKGGVRTCEATRATMPTVIGPARAATSASGCVGCMREAVSSASQVATMQGAPARIRTTLADAARMQLG